MFVSFDVNDLAKIKNLGAHTIYTWITYYFFFGFNLSDKSYKNTVWIFNLLFTPLPPPAMAINIDGIACIVA